MMRNLIYLIFVFAWVNAYGQKLNAKVSESQLMIGQPITITYSVKTGLNDTIRFEPKKDLIEALAVAESSSLSSEGIEFEIVDDFRDTFIVQQQKKEWIGQYVVTAWDSGAFVLPGPVIVINDSTYNFEDVTLICHLTDPIDGVDLYDIKENYAEIPPKPFSLADFLKKHWWWMSIIAVALIIYLVIRRIQRRKREMEDAEDERPISLKERTLIAIEALEAAELWEKGQLKDHFVELSYILRSYLTTRYNVSLLEKTTYETTLILTRKGLEKETVDVIVRILSQSDMVKFAKSKPDVIAILRVSTLAKQVVAETSPLDFDNVD